jgi:hypothetical protein
MINLFISFFYFIKLFFKKQEIDVVFYYPKHFNRGDDNQNLFLKPLFESCKKYNITYLVFEEPDRKSDKKGHINSIPFDFTFYLIILLRKFGFRDKSSSNILSFLFLRNLKFKNVIVLSQSLIEFFRGLDKEAKIFDLQHGIIYSGKGSYISDGKASSNISDNNVQLLLFGQGFKEILDVSDKTNYYKKSTNVLGVQKSKYFRHFNPNRKVLITLQITEDHTEEQNKKMLDEIIKIIDSNEDLDFYMRNHPRFNNCIDISELVKKTNLAPESLIECFALCSIHITSYSTTTFECAEFGIPTIFFQSLKEDFNVFETDFKYPFDIEIVDVIKDYSNYSDEVISWRKKYYSDYDEDKFISLLK